MLLSYGDQQLNLKGIKAVIFDLDGTLVESEVVWTEAKQYIAKREKVKVSQQVMLAYVGMKCYSVMEISSLTLKV